MTQETKPTNPKDAIGCTKLPLDLVPTTGIEEECLAFLEGALKYGKGNWRITGARSSIYIAAIKRHLSKFENGQDRDPTTLVHELASIRACCNIILDAQLNNKLNDDRMPRSPNAEHIDGLVPNVKHLQELFKDYHPHQNTIQDEKSAPTDCANDELCIDDGSRRGIPLTNRPLQGSAPSIVFSDDPEEDLTFEELTEFFAEIGRLRQGAGY